MKKILLFLSLLVISGVPKLSAQIINPNFETWTPDYLVGAPVYDPNTGNPSNGWWDFNFFNYNRLGSSPVTVFRDSVNPSPKSGRYCAKIISQAMDITDWDTLKYYGLSIPDTNGVIFTAYYAAITHIVVRTGIPCSKKLASLSFWYRYIPNGIDTGSCSVAMYHFNNVTKVRELIGGGIWKVDSAVKNWTSATIPIVYDSASLMPDTVIVFFSASSLYSKPHVNDTMNIDSVTTTEAAGINTIAGENANVNVYPNPANTQIAFAIVQGTIQAKIVVVYDITGKLVGTYSMRNNFLTINTQTYNSGIYIYKMFDNTGAQVNVGKFSVIK
jgi:hypothetical protein